MSAAPRSRTSIRRTTSEKRPSEAIASPETHRAARLRKLSNPELLAIAEDVTAEVNRRLEAKDARSAA